MALGGGTGVNVAGASNTVGGTTPAARNIISGSSGFSGVVVQDIATGNVVEGNYIGTDATGPSPWATPSRASTSS